MNLTKENVMEAIKDFPLDPLFNKVIITLNNLEVDGNIVLSENVLSDVQYLVAGEITYRDKKIVPGDKVLIDIEKMMVSVGQESNNQFETQKQIKVDPVSVNGEVFAIIEDRFIKAKDNR